MNAELFAEKGYYLIPVTPRKKGPACIQAWQKDCSNDMQVIGQWAEKFPNCNWGIVGKNVYIVDVDGDAGKESFARLTRELGELPVGPRVETKKGFHLYFQRPTREVGPKTKTVPGIDIRTGDSYALAPGSIHPDGGIYTETIPLCPVEDLPVLPLEWLDVLNPLPKQTAIPQSKTTDISALTDDDYIHCANIVRKIGPSIQGQGGDKALYNVCCVIFWDFGFDTTDQQACDILDEYLGRAQPAWSQREVKHKLNYVLKEPHTNPFGYMRGKDKDAYVDLDFTVNGRTASKKQNKKKEPESDTPKGLILIRGDEIEMTPETWLWKHRIPLGHFTNIFGNGGVSKSALVLDWVARITSGKDWVDGEPNEIGSVLYYSMEIDEADTRAKITLYGGNLKNFYLVKGSYVNAGRNAKLFDLSQLDSLEDTLKQFRNDPERPNIRLIVIDPIISALGKVNENSQNDVRTMLEPVRPVLREYSTSCVYICHSRKPQINIKEMSKDRCAGSQAFTSIARANYEIILDEEHNDKSNRIMLCAKRNGAVRPKGLIYNFTEPVARPELMGRELSDFVWVDVETDMMMDSYVYQKHQEEKEKKKTGNRKVFRNDEGLSAAEWLKENMAPVEEKLGFNETKYPNGLKARAKRAGFKYDPLQRAAKKLGIIFDQTGPETIWRWPPPDYTPPEPVKRDLDEQDFFDSLD